MGQPHAVCADAEPAEPVSEFGTCLRSLRQQRGLSLTELAALVHYSKGYLSKVETGEKPPTPQLAEGCERVLDAGGQLLDLMADATSKPKALRPTPRPAGPRPAQLPPAAADFTGREHELAELNAILAGTSTSAGTPIALIEGLGGMGKTTLALHWAHSLRTRFPDGALFADLRGYHPTGTPAQSHDLLSGFLRALDVPADLIPPDPAAASALLRSTLDGKRMLIMLDDASDAEQIEPLLPGSAGCLVLITSRSRLSALVVRYGARRLRLGGLPGPGAVHLLGTSIGHDRVASEPDATAELINLCANLPLALRIVADRAATRPERPLADLVAELREESGRLDALSVAGDDTTAVGTVFSWSYRALPAPVADSFRMLGLYPGLEFSLVTAAAMLGTTPPTARRLLDTLAAVHLIQESGRDGYRLHELVRLYAAERAASEDGPAVRDAALNRLTTWYLHTVDAADRVLLPSRRRPPLPAPEPTLSLPAFDDYAGALAWCEAHEPIITQLTYRAAQRGQHELAWRLPTACWGFGAIRARWAELIGTHETALDSARIVGDQLGQAIALNNIGISLANLGEFERALVVFEQALTLRRAINDVWGQAAVLNNLGSLRRGRGEFTGAVLAHERAVELFRAVADRCGEGQALNNLGTAYRELGRPDAAMARFRLALKAFTELGDRLGQAETLDSLGTTLLALREFESAVDCHHRAVALFRELGHQGGEANELDNLTTALRAAGDEQPRPPWWWAALAVLEEWDPDRAAPVRAEVLLGA